MQGQRSASEPFCEAFEFEHGSSSSNLVLDQQGFQNDGTHNQLENQNLSSYPLTTGNSSMPGGNVAGLQNANLISWMSVGPSSSLHVGNPNNHNEIKLQNDWTSLSSHRGGRQGTEGSLPHPSNMHSSENLDIDLNINHVENVQPVSQVSDLNGFPHNIGSVDQNLVNTQVSGSGFYSQASVPGILHHQSIPNTSVFSGANESSSRIVNNSHDNGGSQQGLLLGGRCSLHKRKGIELVSGQSSSSGSSSNMNQPGTNIQQEDINTRLGIATRVPLSDPQGLLSFSSTVRNQEGFMRNTRMRINQPVQPDSSTSNICPQGNIVANANNWSAYQASAAPVPSTQLMESRLIAIHESSRSQPNLAATPALSSNTFPILRSGISTSGVGSSSNPLSITNERNAIEEPGLRSLSRNNFTDHPVIHPSGNTRNRDQTPINGALNSGAPVVSGHALPALRGRSVFGAYQPPESSGASSLQRRRLAENFRRSVQLSSSEPRGLNVNLPPLLGHLPAAPETARVAARVHLPPFMSVPPILPDRSNEGAPPIPLPVRHLGRSRNPSEMLYMTDIFRRIDPVLLESVFFGAADFHDRHREMRLDVDNMSYEELLALEERIGNVNTGLDEEKIKKCLNQQKYVPVTSDTSSQDEPCCICQEEYIEGDNLGRLDCGHDFHIACIKQWLLIKNSCPICKNTALNT